MARHERHPKRHPETGPDRTRLRLGTEAARVLAEEGGDYQSAKLKALERLGLPRDTRLPDNREIEQALADHLTLFQSAELAERRRDFARTAIEAMTLLDEFGPRVVGDTVSGNLTRFSKVQLLIPAAPETITLFLDEANIPHDQHQRRMRTGTDRYQQMQTFRFLAGEVPVELISTDTDAGARRLLCPIDGRPMRQVRLQEFRERVAAYG